MEKNNKDFLDIENMTEKMENCGSSVQNLAMSIAFTENPSKLKSSLQNAKNAKKITKNPAEKSLNSKKFNSSLPNLAPKMFLTTFKVEDCNTVKQKLAKLEPILDKYQNPVDHIFREDSLDRKKPLYKVSFHFSNFYKEKGKFFFYKKLAQIQMRPARKRQ